MINSLATPLGAVSGFVIPFAFLGDGDGVDTPETRRKVWMYILVQNIIVFTLSIPIFFFVRNRPETAPSISALKSIYEKPPKQFATFKKLAVNKNYMIHAFSFCGVFITYVCFGAVMSQLSAQFGFKASNNMNNQVCLSNV